MKDLGKDIDWARTYTSSARDSLRNGAMKIDDIADDHPGLAAILNELASQLWAMEGLAREIEGKLSNAHAEVRNGAARG